MTKLGVVVIGTEKYPAHSGPQLARQDDVRLVGAWRLARNFGADADLFDTDLPCGIAITSFDRRYLPSLT